MREKIMGRRAIGLAVPMALVAVGAVLTFEKPPEAATPTQRGIQVSPPIEVREDYRVRLAAFNAGNRAVSCRFRLLNAVTGVAIDGSDPFDLSSGTGAIFDVDIDTNGEVVGTVVCDDHSIALSHIRASTQVFNAADEPVGLLSPEEIDNI